MGSFPALKTGAAAQYPIIRALQHSTQVLRFLDGTEQRFREYRSPLQKWVIRLDLLDDDELSRVEEFFVSEQGRSGSFSFIDPRDGVTYPDCSLGSDLMEMSFREEMRGQTMLIIHENAG